MWDESQKGVANRVTNLLSDEAGQKVRDSLIIYGS